MIEPVGCNGRILKWEIDGVENAVAADFHDDFSECLRAEIAACCYVKVFSQIVAYRKLCFRFGAQGSRYAVVNPPNTARQSLAQVAEDYLELWIVVEQAAAHEPKRVN